MLRGIVPVFSFALLAALFFVQVFLHKKESVERRDALIERAAKIGFVLGLAAVLGDYFFLVAAQYSTWKNSNPPLSFLVPPYRSIGYVFYYHFTRFLLYYLPSFVVSAAIFISAKYGNKRFGEHFFESGEPYLAAVPLFLLGYPEWNYLWIPYFLAVLGTVFAVSLFRIIAAKRQERFSPYFLWLPVAIIGIIVSETSVLF